MHKARLEAFSDGVIAILITIMVLEFKVPQGSELADLLPLAPTFLAYVISFVFLGIYWNNHHHLLQSAKTVNGSILWANNHWLFWLSLIPFSTAWMGKNGTEAWPVALYGLNLLMCAIAYTILVTALVRHHGPQSQIAQAIGRDSKGKVSLGIYVAATCCAFFWAPLSYLGYIVVAIIWLMPDQRIERAIGGD
jgi:uncharacterized membrane protein